MKKSLKKLVSSILGWQVLRLRKRNDFKLIVVAGSIGKTSTKFAIAQVLSSSLRVRFQEGNYNDIVSVSLVFFDQKMPTLMNPFQWLGIFIKNEIKILKPYVYDVVVVEVGTDGPGQIESFSKYIDADIGVLTAITPEHMEYFESIDSVAREELSIFKLAKKILVNTDLVNSKYLKERVYQGYSLVGNSDYSATNDGERIIVEKSGREFLRFNSSASKLESFSVLAATAIADLLSIPADDIRKGLMRIKPVNGRINMLNGQNGSLIIDDTYNASPLATIEAMNFLYKFNKQHKIALLGNMNELGAMSEAAHKEVGEYCDPKQLDLVVTIGEHANKFLAEAATKKGCKVLTFDSPYKAGRHISGLLNEDTVVLAKGSQNGVFAEEAVKKLLDNPNDQSKLVRQDNKWMKIKKRQFHDWNQ